MSIESIWPFEQRDDFKIYLNIDKIVAWKKKAHVKKMALKIHPDKRQGPIFKFPEKDEKTKKKLVEFEEYLLKTFLSYDEKRHILNDEDIAFPRRIKNEFKEIIGNIKEIKSRSEEIYEVLGNLVFKGEMLQKHIDDTELRKKREKREAEACAAEKERRKAERKAKADAKRKAKADAKRKAKEGASESGLTQAERDSFATVNEVKDENNNEEAERKAKEEEERKAREEIERKAREEMERKAREEIERKAREEIERKAREEIQRKALKVDGSETRRGRRISSRKKKMTMIYDPSEKAHLHKKKKMAKKTTKKRTFTQLNLSGLTAPSEPETKMYCLHHPQNARSYFTRNIATKPRYMNILKRECANKWARRSAIYKTMKSELSGSGVCNPNVSRWKDKAVAVVDMGVGSVFMRKLAYWEVYMVV